MSAGARLAAMLIAAIVAVPALMVLVTGFVAANPRTVQECHAALTFPDTSCSPRSGGWWCDGAPVETRMCYRASEGDPR